MSNYGDTFAKSLYPSHNLKNVPILFRIFWDIWTFFDSDSLKGVLSQAYNLGVKGKAYRLLYKINEKSSIKVKTPLGVTPEVERDEGLGQGGIDSGILSAGSIGQSVAEYFSNSDNETS